MRIRDEYLHGSDLTGVVKKIEVTIGTGDNANKSVIKYTKADSTGGIVEVPIGDITGKAATASKLDNTSAIGSKINPVYFTEKGVPSACTYSLNATVPVGSANKVLYYSALNTLDVQSYATLTSNLDVFTVATASAAGKKGLVPAPSANQLGAGNFFLRADGVWTVIENKSAALNGTATSLVTTGEKYNWNSAYNWYNSMTSGDTDGVINKWKEVEAFLANYGDSSTLAAELAKLVTLSTDQTITGVKTFSEVINGSITGNAGTANKLKNTVNINGVAFDGSTDIIITAVATGGNSDTVGGYSPSDFLLKTEHETFESVIATALTDLDNRKIEASDIPTSLPANGGNADTVDGIDGASIFRQIRKFGGVSSDNTWIKIQKKGAYNVGTCLISVYQYGDVCSFIFSISNTYPIYSTLALISKDRGSLASNFKLSYSTSEGCFYFKIARDYDVFIYGSKVADAMLGAGELVTSTPEDLIECYNISINVADTAKSVDWSGVTNKPSSFTPSSHTHEKITHKLWEYEDAISDTTSPADICANFSVPTSLVSAVFTGMVQTSYGKRYQSLFWTNYGAAGLVELTKSYGDDGRLSYRVSKGWADDGANWSTAGYRELANVEDLTWANIQNKPETATRWPSWSEVTSKPTNVSSFTNDAGYLTSHAYSYGSIDIYDINGAKKTSNNTISASVNTETLRLQEGANITITATNSGTSGSDNIKIDVTGITSNIDRNGYGKLALWYNGASEVSTTLQSATFNELLTVKAGSGIDFSALNNVANSDVWTISAIPYNCAITLNNNSIKSLIKDTWSADALSVYLTSNGTSSGTSLAAGTYALWIEDRSSDSGTPNYYSGTFTCAGSATAGRLDEIALHSSMATSADTNAPTRIFVATQISGTPGKHVLRFCSLDSSATSHYLTVKVNKII